MDLTQRLNEISQKIRGIEDGTVVVEDDLLIHVHSTLVLGKKWIGGNGGLPIGAPRRVDYDRAVAMRSQGVRVHDIATEYGVSKQCIYRILQKKQKE